jgi:hypothetical protein
MRLVAATLLYFATVFGAGFLFGAIRVFLLESRLGKAGATLCEAPFLLAVMIFAARASPRWTGLSMGGGSLITMGVAALLLQQGADIAIGTLVRGLTLRAQLRNFATPAGIVYALLLLLFTAMPLLANWRGIALE